MSETKQANIGMVGLAVMGRNLALNIADHGFRVGVWNLEQPVTDKFVAENGSEKFVGTKSLAELCSSDHDVSG
jgi:6-phosphogluconate dehydrogenase